MSRAQLYGQAYPTMTTNGLKEEHTRLQSRRRRLHALTARKPRSRYPVGKKSRLMSTLGRIVPDTPSTPCACACSASPERSPLS
ncbi:hypothetical protein [Nonomuraea turcica]|uniref:hypothetical protein n=1 Tax=Nonomuraea sp. G32 TaxID=3067274 RepID=UPI00273B29CD|nr:hypothetical protein [Nonomuraea sp. G32]MDP4511237.1 hypothetical protein [Nonomuraea sp. G32]